MKKKRPPKFTGKDLLARGVPAVLIPGLLLAFALGWNGGPLQKQTDYHSLPEVFPYQGTVEHVYDGDTFQLESGHQVRLLGIDAPNRGEDGYHAAQQELEQRIGKRTVYLEYDRYQDDKYGRLLAWVWIECEKKPVFLPPDYMHETNNRSKPGLLNNPSGCTRGKLVNEELAKQGYAEFVTYKDRGALKYQERILHPE